MRTQFIRTLMEIAGENERVWLVNGDLGYSVLETFGEAFPARYLNAGVAEQNMTGIAAGLAMAGKTVFTYSIANFPIFRCLEQIRNDVCYHDLDVKIVAVGGGLAYGSAGYSHHAVEDLAIMRALPNMTVFAPADPVETALVTRAAVAHRGPCYLRLGKAGEQVLHQTVPHFEIGKGIVVRSGDDLAIVSTGSTLAVALQAADVLAARGRHATVISMATVKPIDSALLAQLVAAGSPLFTIEEHGSGGLGAAVAEVVAAGLRTGPFRAFRLPDVPISRGGTQEGLRKTAGLDPDFLAAEMETALGRRNA